MRQKFLSVIVSFICLSVGISACMDDEETYAYSSDASIRAFGLDTIHGRHYKFTIDQVQRLIYNKDSLPMGADTILDRILIDTLSSTGWVTSGAPQDTLLSTTDSLDLRPAINAQGSDGIKLNSHAADGTSYSYTLQIRVHLQDPDSMSWSRLSDNDPLTLATPADELKSILFGDELLLYTSAGELYRHPAAPLSQGWNASSLEGLPQSAQLSTMQEFRSLLYVATTDGNVYRSEEGSNWSLDEALSGGIETLVATFPANDVTYMDETLVAIRTADSGEKHFVTTTDGMQWMVGEAVTDDFPTRDLSFTATTTANGVGKVLVVGRTTEEEPTCLTPWFSLSADDWAALSNNSDSGLPPYTHPFLTHYAGLYSCTGGDLTTLYTSQTGIVWEESDEKFRLPDELAGQAPYTLLSDPTVKADEKRDYLWAITAQGTTCTVWRGRLNRLGFVSTH